MNSGISTKLIFYFFLLFSFPLYFISFNQPAKSSDLNTINKGDNNSVNKGPSNNLNNKESSNLLLNTNFEKNSFKKSLLDKISRSQLAYLRQKPGELVIQSDKQSEINNVIYAEGNVSASYKGKLLKSDILIYDKSNKTITAKGGITLILGDQIFKLSQLEYSFISQKGYLLDVKGSINVNTLINDLSSNFSLSDFNKIENLLDLKKRKF